MDQILFQASIWILPVLIAITLHEAAHGWMAWRLGDDTAFRLGRVTFNPLRHIDPVGTVFLPALLLVLSHGQMLFGFAKPVPVNFARLHVPRRDMILVAAAGPGINIVLAVAAALLLHGAALLPGSAGSWAGHNLHNAVLINVLLAVFNMLPVPPLDGGRVAVGMLPSALGARLARFEPYGLLLILAAIFLLPWVGHYASVDLDVFGWLVLTPTEWVSDMILALAGVS